MTAQIWTIGHSTRKIDIFISLLEANGIKSVVDVRKLPGSKRYPQFNKDALMIRYSRRSATEASCTSGGNDLALTVVP